MARDVPDHFFRQSGVVPCRAGASGLEVLLITSLGRGRWIVPKGVIEPGMSPEESAALEAAEEAGVEGVVGPELGQLTRDKWGGTCQIRLFVMEVTRVHDEWPEGDLRQREWLALGEAKARTRSSLRRVLRRVPRTWKRWRDGR